VKTTPRAAIIDGFAASRKTGIALRAARGVFSSRSRAKGRNSNIQEGENVMRSISALQGPLQPAQRPFTQVQ
jgi:hypothetical protein